MAACQVPNIFGTPLEAVGLLIPAQKAGSSTSEVVPTCRDPTECVVLRTQRSSRSVGQPTAAAGFGARYPVGTVTDPTVNVPTCRDPTFLFLPKVRLRRTLLKAVRTPLKAEGRPLLKASPAAPQAKRSSRPEGPLAPGRSLHSSVVVGSPNRIQVLRMLLSVTTLLARMVASPMVSLSPLKSRR